ncbi:MAG: FHA domain-containing protein [Cyanobacteria bacterium SZAS LIN-3]|nr:FHA domain-containing protein [Cyanobacteria bacterium SZAS LIN-3]
MDNNQDGNKAPTAFLVDLVSNRKIPIATPRCRVGRDDLNDIVISGDQSISRFHFIISYENGEFTVQDAKSRHGTFLNGNQLTVSESIKDGDVLKVGVSLFWFVVEGAQSESADPAAPTRVSAITESEKAAAADSKVSVKAGSEMDATMAPSPRSQEMTQEMQKPDAALMDKLEEAANSIKIEEKPQPKASLASLLSGASQAASEPEPEADKKKEELAALAAKDKELLSEIEEEESKAEKVDEAKPEPAALEDSKEETGEEAKEEAREEGKEELKEEQIPARPTNKPSDTVTLEALNPPGTAAAAANAAEEATSTSSQLDRVPASAEPAEEVKAEAPAVEDAAPVASSEAAATDEATTESSDKAEPIAKSENSTTAEANAEIIDAGGEAQSKTSSDTEPEPSLETNAHDLEVGTNGAGSSKGKSDNAEEALKVDSGRESKVSSESQDVEVTKFIKAGASAVPDWCKRYFSDEIAKLNSELDELNEQVRAAQQKIRDVETRVALTRGIRNTLLTTTGDELVEACGKVLSLLGWKVTMSTEDKHELRLEVEDKHVCIARVIWTTTKAERSHLGQLSISQTRYWMEKGVEPKGIIIVSKISGEAPTAVGDSPEEIELNDYAAKRNVCLMSTLQLLSLYKEIALADASPDKLRTSIVNASGWLAGHNLEPGTAEVVEDDAPASKDSNKLSSLLSA